MTVEEIFNKLYAHMQLGLIYHDTFIQAYDFLGLYGYSKCHSYHYFEENKGMNELRHYYATHYFKLLRPDSIETPTIIPVTWYKYTSQAVDNSTRKGAIKELMNSWMKWEENTKQFYQQMHNELDSIGEFSAMLKVDEYLKDVEKELHNIQKDILYLESIGYNLEIIMPEQEKLRTKYKHALKKIF